MPQSSKRIIIALSILMSLIAIFSLLAFYRGDRTSTLAETYGEAEIHIETSRNAILFPSECIILNWDMTNIVSASLTINGKMRPINNVDERDYCLWHASDPIFDVEFQDNTSSAYTLKVQHLYGSFPIFVLIILSMISFFVLAYMLFDVPGVLFVVTIISFTPFLMTQSHAGYDYSIHIDFIRNMLVEGNVQELPPHFTFHYITLFLNKLIPSIGLDNAAYTVTIIAQGLSAVALYTLLNTLQTQTSDNKRIKYFNATLAYLLLWAGSISFFTRNFDLQMETALLFANTYHSPTMIVMRLLSIMLFILLIQAPEKWSKAVVAHIAGIALLVLVGAYAKPNYIMLIVPAYIVLLGIQYLRDRRVSKLQLLVASTLIITMIVALGWQYIAVYDDASQNVIAQAESGIRLDFYRLYRVWGIEPQTVLIEWFSSLIFPLSVYLLYIKQTWRDDYLNFAWIALAGAIAMIVLFIEVPRTADGNFVWGSRITTLIVYAVSLAHIMRHHQMRTSKTIDWRFWFCMSLFGLHVLHYSYVSLNAYL